MELTRVFGKINDAWLAGKRHIWVEGGTAAAKTYSIIQFLFLLSKYAKSPLMVSCVSESLPHLKKGVVRDYFRIIGESPDNNPRYNKTDLVYNFGKTKMEFFSADDSSKLRGARRDVLFINEINNITYDAYRELDARTRLCTISDWNPVSEFFFHQQRFGDDPDSAYIHATYRDAIEVVPQEVIKNILLMGEHDPNWANVFLEGRLGKIEGLVYPAFEQVGELPSGDFFFGLDWGFSGDPTALSKHVIRGDSLYSQELIYETNMTNQDIGQRMDSLGIKKHYDEIFADSAEPKSIEEIYQMGFNIKPCSKGPGSVEFGHQKVRQYKLYWTADSVNGIKEQRNFRYIEDKNHEPTKKTTHSFSHLMDARRYAVVGWTQVEDKEEVVVFDAMRLIDISY